MSKNNNKSNIVIVDDIPANLRLLAGILARDNFMIRPIPDPLMALSAIKAEPPDIILLDIMMPTMSGYDVCSCLKSDPDTKDIPIIFITARDDVEDKVKGFSLGAVDYITKPFQADDVIIRVQTHLKIYNLQRNLQKKSEELEMVNKQLESENYERRKIEEALRESNLWLDCVFNALEEAVIILNPDRIIIDANPAAARIFGYTRDELKGESCEILHVDSKHFEEFKNKTYESFSREESVNFEYRLKRKDGTIFPSEHSLSILKTKNQNSIGMVSVVRDMTEKREAEERIKETERLAAVLEIAGAVCHELNQPLMNISGYTELALMDIPPTDPAHTKLEKIQQQVDRMALITKKLMRISRYRTKDYPDCKIFDLAEASEEC